MEKLWRACVIVVHLLARSKEAIIGPVEGPGGCRLRPPLPHQAAQTSSTFAAVFNSRAPTGKDEGGRLKDESERPNQLRIGDLGLGFRKLEG